MSIFTASFYKSLILRIVAMSDTSSYVALIQLAQEHFDRALLSFIQTQKQEIIVIGQEVSKSDFQNYSFISNHSQEEYATVLKNVQSTFGFWNLFFLPVRLIDLQEGTPNHIQQTWSFLKFIVPQLAENGGGQIILLSYTHQQDIDNEDKLVAYQQAIGGFMRTLALETTQLNVRINLIHLPIIKKQETDSFSEEMQEILTYLLDKENNNITATEQWISELF